MQNVRFFLAVIALFTAVLASAQNQAVIQNYIDTYKEMAIAEMQRTGVPASIKLAQGIHETMAGTSELVIKSNNHFGIKCKTGWNGPSVSHDDDARGECFRKYESPEDSYRDHSNFLKNSTRYASLFKLDPLDYSGWAYGLKKAGYATNPRYPQVVIKLIKDYHLQDYTLIALGKGPLKDDEVLAGNEVSRDNHIIPAVSVTTVPQETPRPAAPVKKVVKQYPSGEFKINDTRVIYAKEGNSFLSIAEQYHIALSRIFEFNDLQQAEMLAADQLIYLQRKRRTGNSEFHIVQEGETLYDIAQEQGIRLESLLEYNQLEKYMQPAPGEQLYLRAKAPVRPALVIGNASNIASTAAINVVDEPFVESQPIAPKLTMHTVQAKETIYSISKKHNVKIEELVEWNRLTSNNLKTGQQLKIYK